MHAIFPCSINVFFDLTFCHYDDAPVIVNW